MFKKVTSLMIFSMLFAFTATSYAQTDKLTDSKANQQNAYKACNINIEYKDYQNLQFYNVLNHYNSIVYPENSKMRIPEPEIVKSASLSVFTSLQKEGIDPSSIAIDGTSLSIHITNIKLKEALGHYFHPNLIYIYSENMGYLSEEEIYGTTIHEIGHFIEMNYFDSDDFAKYVKIRKINPEWKNNDQEWGKQPREIFAEDFEQIFLPNRFTFTNKSNLPSMDKATEEKVKNLILEVLKKHTKPLIVNDKYTDLLINEDILSSDSFAICNNEKDIYLNSELTRNNFMEWIQNTFKVVDDDYSKRLSRMDLQQEIGVVTNENYFSNSPMTKKDMKALLLYFEQDLASTLGKKYIEEINAKDMNKIHSLKSLNPSSSYYNSVKFLSTQNIISSKNKFNPNEDINRLQAGLILYRALELEPATDVSKQLSHFSDIDTKHPYAKEIATLRKHGIFKGNSNGKFGENDILTREQMATIIVRAFQLKENGNAKTKFKDTNKISKAFINDVHILSQNKITLGKGDGRFSPKEYVTNGEYALFIDRVLRKSLSEGTIVKTNNKNEKSYLLYLNLKETNNKMKYKGNNYNYTFSNEKGIDILLLILNKESK